MERKQGGESWVQNSNISINVDDNHHHHHHFHHDENDDEGLCLLKRDISSHSLYSLLLQSHFNCLKLCLGNFENEINNETAIPNQHANLFKDDRSELDQFMEAYCVSLQKLKEEMEEPQQESMAFIDFMYSQLDDLLIDINPSSTSGGESS